MKILLVEDDESLGSIMVKLFKSRGYETDWVMDGEECFERVSSDPFSYDIIILDWMLPNCNGDVICKKLRQTFNYNGGIIFVTAKDSMVDVVEGLGIGADDYIIKPFENCELISHMELLASQKSGTKNAKN